MYYKFDRKIYQSADFNDIWQGDTLIYEKQIRYTGR